MRGQALRGAAVRVGALRLALLFAFLLLAARAGQLTVVNTEGKHLGGLQGNARIQLPPARGLILDRRHKELAITVDAPSVYLVPKNLANPQVAVDRLAPLLGMERRTLAGRAASHPGFLFAARWISEDRASRIEQLIDELGTRGIGIEREPRRVYPAGELAASLLGFADIDGNGVRGVEQMMDEWLKGAPRTLEVRRDARGTLLSDTPLDPRTAVGGDVVLSIDARMQAEAESALAAAVQSTGSRGGVAITVDPRNGDILSLAETPRFDPNRFRQLKYEQTRSRAFVDLVEPGSTFKAFLVAAALEAGTLAAGEPLDLSEGRLRVRGKTITDHHPHGPLDAAGILRVSSNVGAVKIAQALGREAHYEALLRFGFGVATGSGFPGETAGLLRPWQRWREVDQATVAFGQGVSVTPIQLAMATAALANRGERMQPRLVLARRRPLGEWQETAPVSLGRAVSPETARQVLAMLESVVSATGTGRLAALAGVEVAGKTGTAQLLDRDTGRYSQKRYTAWFIGVAPARDPQLAVVVGLDEPEGSAHTGGAVAAPLFARIAAAQLAHRGVITEPEPIRAQPDPTLLAAIRAREAEAGATTTSADASPREVAQPVQEALPKVARVERRTPRRSEPKPRPTAVPGPDLVLATAVTPAAAAVASTPPPGWLSEAESARDPYRAVLVPDFRGTNLRGATQLAIEQALDLRIQGSGDGRVTAQSPAPGTIVGGNDRSVLLRFDARRGEG